jgi:F0F1-type ATP synthase epsilon subunit
MQKLDLTVRNRDNLIFEGKVESITSYNTKGRFDVLPSHANFISLLEKYLIYRTIDGQENNIPINNGILRVSNDQVKVYLGIGEW